MRGRPGPPLSPRVSATILLSLLTVFPSQHWPHRVVGQPWVLMRIQSSLDTLISCSFSRKFPSYISVTEASRCAGCVWPWPRWGADLGHLTKVCNWVAFSQQWLSGLEGSLSPSPYCPQEVLVLLCPAQGRCGHPPPPLCTRLESVHPGPVPRADPAQRLTEPAGMTPSGHLRRKTPSWAPSIVTAAATGAQRLCMAAQGRPGPRPPPLCTWAALPHPHTSPFNWAFSLTGCHVGMFCQRRHNLCSLKPGGAERPVQAEIAPAPGSLKAGGRSLDPRCVRDILGPRRLPRPTLLRPGHGPGPRHRQETQGGSVPSSGHGGIVPRQCTWLALVGRPAWAAGRRKIQHKLQSCLFLNSWCGACLGLESSPSTITFLPCLRQNLLVLVTNADPVLPLEGGPMSLRVWS